MRIVALATLFSMGVRVESKDYSEGNWGIPFEGYRHPTSEVDPVQALWGLEGRDFILRRHELLLQLLISASSLAILAASSPSLAMACALT